MATIINSNIGLGIYTKPKQEARVSSETPLLFAIDGTIKTIYEHRLYLGSNDEVHAYTGDPYPNNIKISIVDNRGISDGSIPGWSIKMKAGDARPTQDEWDSVSKGAFIEVPGIADMYNDMNGCLYLYHPFWVRIEVPKYVPRQMITDVYFRIEALRQDVDWYAKLTGVI